MNWDDKKDDDFNGFAKKDGTYHEHDYQNGICTVCNLTREQVRKSWK